MHLGPASDVSRIVRGESPWLGRGGRASTKRARSVVRSRVRNEGPLLLFVLVPLLCRIRYM